MTSMSSPRRGTSCRVSASLLCAALTSAATVPASAQFTVDRELRFGKATDKGQAALHQAPAARQIVAGDFVLAVEDLDGDGHREAILLARSPSLCLDGRCTLLVLKRSANGIETLLLQRVPTRLALTKERVNGYQAIVALDEMGRVAIGDRRDAALAGKPLIYPMGSGTTAQPPVVATTPATSKPEPVASAKRRDKPTLEDIIDTIVRPSAKGSKADWASMEGIPGLKMRQAKGALIETPKGFRRGGQVTLQDLGSTSVTWEGDHEKVYTADVRMSTHISTDRYSVALRQQFSPSAQLKQIRGGCKANDWDRESAIFQVNLPNRRLVYLRVNSTPTDNGGNTTIQVAPEVENWWSC